MLSGVPCIASKVGDSLNIIGKNGYLFEIGDSNKFIDCILKSLDNLRNSYKWQLKKIT